MLLIISSVSNDGLGLHWSYYLCLSLSIYMILILANIFFLILIVSAYR